MNCEICKNLLTIDKARTEVEGDSSDNTKTKVFTVLAYTCRNPRCANSGRVVKETKNLIYEK